MVSPLRSIANHSFLDYYYILKEKPVDIPAPLNNVQAVFLGQIREKLLHNNSMADELAEILNISRDSAYRRIRGETVLSLDEVRKLHDHYGLSVDSIISPDSNQVLIHHSAADFKYSIKDWIKSLVEQLMLAKSTQKLELIYAAKDIPVFYYFRSPELTAFKLFVWSKSVIKDPAYEHVPFSIDIIPKEILAEAERAWLLYASIPTTEIWSDEVINGTLKQIEFYHECDFFSHQDTASLLINQLSAFINQIKKEVAIGKKSEEGNLTLYQNEILIPDNTIYGSFNGQRVVYINYNTMDLLTIYQDSFCEKTEAYMNSLIKNSSLISVTAEKERNKFFNKIESKIAEIKEKLKL